MNPACVDKDGVARSGRFYYSTVGYGVFSLLGERYRMGRIEIFDKDGNNFEFSFGIDTHGELKEFLDHLYDKGENDEKE